MTNLLHLLLLLLPFLLAKISNTSTYPNCPSYNCGALTISYPFWKMGSAQLCGYEGFGINCTAGGCYNQGVPQITIGGDFYYVQDIDYESKNIIVADSNNVMLVDSDFLDCRSYTFGNNNMTFNLSVPTVLSYCPSPSVLHGINLETLPLKFSTLNVNLSFHFNCTGCPSFANEVRCSETNERKSCVHVMNTSTDWNDYGCTNEVVTPVIRTVTNSFTNLSDWYELNILLGIGFNLEWRRMDDCDKCEESNGRCGSHDTTGFMCFCTDGTISMDDCRGVNTNLRTKLIIGLGSAVVSFVMILVIYCFWKPLSRICVDSLKHKTEEDKNIEAFVMQYGSLSTKRYTYSEIKKITNSFKVKLGQGGFGQVFKGKLSDGRLVAVKLLNSSKENGQEFINEVASIGRTSHVNIVALLGFCFNYKKRALVYEYMPNGSLEKFIHSHVPLESSENIGVKKLYEIALGIASGLDYLHRGCSTRILHLDIKPHNILLDEDFCPKIADFGLAKLYSRKESIVSMLEARGTIGYIAPEVYNKNFGGVSHKSDVYSYGMLLLEMVGGRKNVDIEVGPGRTSEIYFPDLIYKRLHKDGFLLDSVTTAEENDYAKKMTITGLWCIQPAPNQRPSIDQVIEMLEGSIDALKVPPKPIFSSPSRKAATTSTSSESMSEITN